MTVLSLSDTTIMTQYQLAWPVVKKLFVFNGLALGTPEVSWGFPDQKALIFQWFSTGVSGGPPGYFAKTHICLA